MKILVLTSIYPSPDIEIANNTNVVHYFALEWIKQGHEVLVIHNYPIYLRIFHLIGSCAKKLIASKFNTSVTSHYISKSKEFIMDGVDVVRMPLFKPFPHGKVPRKSLSKQIETIKDYCLRRGFIPDYITSHNFYPHLEMVNQLKRDSFPNARTCVVVHKQNLNMLNFVDDYHKEINLVDIWGYRSLSLKREFESFTGLNPNHFMCYSGIPTQFLQTQKLFSPKQPISNFIYVGSFIRRKYPEKLLHAIKKAKISDFRLTYVGDGENKNLIQNIIKSYGWQDNVTLCGYVQRNQVPDLLAKSQCFIMISEGESFGLVYLEAMAIGLIVIASKNEGMEGIIEDGVNGFLCKAGDDNELASILIKIRSLSDKQLHSISDKARKKAQEMTDSNVAKNYANALMKTSEPK